MRRMAAARSGTPDPDRCRADVARVRCCAIPESLTVSRRTTHAAAPRRASLISFLDFNRKVLAIGGVAVLGGATVLPAVATLVPERLPVAAAAQTLEVPSFARPELVSRDAFGISNFSVVQWPVASGSPVSSPFGVRSCAGCTENHTGVDLTPGRGTPVAVVADGVVTEAGYASDWGVYAIVEHTINGQTLSTLYAHMEEGSLKVSAGQTIDRGTVVGAVGNSGLSTGPHLHFAVMIGGRDAYVDPYAWLLANVNS